MKVVCCSSSAVISAQPRTIRVTSGRLPFKVVRQPLHTLPSTLQLSRTSRWRGSNRLSSGRVWRVRCEQGDGDDKKGADKEEADDLNQVDLKKLGPFAKKVTPENAKKTYNALQELGIDTPEKLKEFYTPKFVSIAGFQAANILVNLLIVGACLKSFELSNQTGGPLRFPLCAVACTFAINYGVNAVLGLVTLGSTAVAAFSFGANAEAFLQQVEAMSVEKPKISALDAAYKVINTVKLLQKLSTVKFQLQSTAGEEDASTVDNLSALLAVQQARASPDFSIKKELSDTELMRIAKAFKKFDLNDDNRLQSEELANLADTLGVKLSAEEVLVALDTLDTDKSGTIELDEFVDWWTDNCLQEPCLVEPEVLPED